MSFIAAIKSGFGKTFNFSGRANRREFWFWIAYCCLILFIANFMDGAFIAPALGFLPFEEEAGRPLATLFSVLLLVPTISCAVRRFHDSNLKGWWLLAVLTVVGAIPVAYFLVKKAKKGPNRFDIETD